MENKETILKKKNWIDCLNFMPNDYPILTTNMEVICFNESQGKIIETDGHNFKLLNSLSGSLNSKFNKMDIRKYRIINNNLDNWQKETDQWLSNNKITCWYCEAEKKIQTGLCEKCGKFGKTNREIALYWWKSLEIYQQMNFANNYFTKDDSCNLTDNEIEEIYLKEHGDKENLSIIYNITSEARPKRNKFQSFNIKKARAYINKLSEEGKDKMIKMLGGYTIVELNNKCHDAWIDSFFLKRNTDITGFNDWQNKNLL